MISTLIQIPQRLGYGEMAGATLCGLIPVVVFLWKQQADRRKKGHGEFVKAPEGQVLIVDDDASSIANTKSIGTSSRGTGGRTWD